MTGPGELEAVSARIGAALFGCQGIAQTYATDPAA